MLSYPYQDGSVTSAVATAIGYAVTRQWAVDQLNDEASTTKMAAINRAEISRIADALIAYGSWDDLAPKVPASAPPGSHMEWTGVGWILVLPEIAKPVPSKQPQPHWGAIDLCACGILLQEAAQTVEAVALQEELMTTGERLINAGIPAL
jgi:hypothetical protein